MLLLRPHWPSSTSLWFESDNQSIPCALSCMWLLHQSQLWLALLYWSLACVNHCPTPLWDTLRRVVLLHQAKCNLLLRCSLPIMHQSQNLHIFARLEASFPTQAALKEKCTYDSIWILPRKTDSGLGSISSSNVLKGTIVPSSLKSSTCPLIRVLFLMIGRDPAWLQCINWWP